MTFRVGCYIEATDGCCGVSQITQFTGELSAWDGRTIEASGETMEQAYADLFGQLRAFSFEETLEEDFTCAVVQMWFFKGHNYDKVDNPIYEAESLRLLVETIPNVMNLGEYRNPNTGNLIKGYQWQVN